MLNTLRQAHAVAAQEYLYQAARLLDEVGGDARFWVSVVPPLIVAASWGLIIYTIAPILADSSRGHTASAGRCPRPRACHRPWPRGDVPSLPCAQRSLSVAAEGEGPARRTMAAKHDPWARLGRRMTRLRLAVSDSFGINLSLILVVVYQLGVRC